MSEFENRIEAQRKLIKTVNERISHGERLSALTEPSIDRWASANRRVADDRVVKILRNASKEIFAMANHSDDPVCGTYRLSAEELASLTKELEQIEV